MPAELFWEEAPARVERAIRINRTRLLGRLGRIPDPSLPGGARAVLYRTGVPWSWLNGVADLEVGERHLEESVGALVRWGNRGHVPWSFWVPDEEESGPLPGLLLSYGLDREEELAGLAIDLREARQPAPVVPGLLTQRVGSESDFRLFLFAWSRAVQPATPAVPELLAQWWVERDLKSDASLRLLLGLVDGRPAATALLFVEGSVAGIYGLAVDPQYRGQHVATAMVHIALRTAAGFGLSGAVTTVPEASSGPFRRLGFAQYDHVSRFAIDPAEVPAFERDPP